MTLAVLSPFQKFGGDRMGHGGQIRAIAWAHAAPRLASAGSDNMIRVWNTETGRATSVIPLPFGVGRGFLRFWDDDTLLLFDRDGFTLVGVDGGPSRAVGAPSLVTRDPWWQEDITASPDGRVVALLERYRDYKKAGAPERERVRAIELPSGRVLHELSVSLDVLDLLPSESAASVAGTTLCALAIAPDGQRLAAVFALRGPAAPNAAPDLRGWYLTAWDLRSGARRFVAAVDAGEGAFLAGSQNLRYSPDGTRLLTTWGQALLFDAGTGDLLRALAPPRPSAVDATIDAGDWADGGRTVLGANHERVFAWDADTGELRASRAFDKRAFVLDVRASDARRAVAVVDNTAVLTFGLPELTARLAASGHAQAVRAVAVSTRSKRVLSSDNESLKSWDLATGACLWTRPSGECFALEMSPDGTQCYAAFAYHSHVFDVNMGAALSSGEQPLEVACWLDDGRLVHLGYREEAEGATLMVGEGSDAYIVDRIRSEFLRCVPALSADGRRALVWEESHAFGWDVERRAQVWKRPLALTAAALSHDGRYAAVATRGSRAIEILDQETGDVRATLNTPNEEVQRCLCWSPAGHRLLYGLDDGHLALAEVDVTALAPGSVTDLTGPSVIFQTGRLSAVRAVSFARDGSLVVAGTADGSVYAWQLPARRGG